MYKIIFWALAIIYSTPIYASARVCLNKSGIVEVKANLKFYGSQNKLGPKCAQEIERMFNAPKAEVAIGDKKYKVQFKITHELISEEEAFGIASLNASSETNYIRIEDKATNEKNGRSNHILGGNCGFYASSDDLGSSTTCTHEFAHGLGLKHYNERPENQNKPMKGADLRGAGQPGIMAARGFIVDSKYQYDPKAKIGKTGATINPIHRIVTLKDILDLNLARLPYNLYNCADLGSAHNLTYSKDGTGEVWRGWKFVFDAMDDVIAGKLGLSPSQCKP